MHRSHPYYRHSQPARADCKDQDAALTIPRSVLTATAMRNSELPPKDTRLLSVRRACRAGLANPFNCSTAARQCGHGSPAHPATVLFAAPGCIRFPRLIRLQHSKGAAITLDQQPSPSCPQTSPEVAHLAVHFDKESILALLRGVSIILSIFAQQGPGGQQKLLTWLSIVLTKEGASLRGVAMPPESS